MTVYTPQNGALFSGANSVFQDHTGWMWFTNSYDVVRYDGHRFRIYPPVANCKMDYCYGIHEVANELWIMASPQHLKVSGDSLVPLVFPEGNPEITAYTRMGNQHYVLGDQGLFEYSNGLFREITNNVTFPFTGNETMLPFLDSILISYSWRKSIYLFSPQTGKYYELPMPVNALAQNREGRTFILLQEKGVFELTGVNVYDGTLQPLLKPYYAITDPKAEQIEVDGLGNIWIGFQDKYLLKISPNKSIHTYNELDKLPSLWFYKIFCDVENNVWIAMNNGVCKIVPAYYKRFTKDQGLYSNHVSFIRRGPGKNNLFIGTYTGVNLVSDDVIYSLKTGTLPFTCQHLVFDHTLLYYIRDSSLYAGTLDTLHYEIINERLLASLPARGLYLDMDSMGTVFLATVKGMYAWFNQNLTKTLTDDRHYHTMLIDHQQQLWAGDFADRLKGYRIMYTSAGPKLDPLSIAPDVQKSFDEIIRIRAFAYDGKNKVFAGTRYNGLYAIESKDNTITNIRHWDETDSLNSNSIWGISVEPAGICWAATARGLCRIDVDEGGISDVGQSARIIQAASVLALPDQSVWIGSHPGVVKLEKDKSHQQHFEIFITGISVNGQILTRNIDKNKRHLFPYDQNNISFDFTANTFLFEEDVRYSYRLVKNSESTWSHPENQHTIHYPSLSPGRYTFQVKARNNAGAGSGPDAEWSFEIKPPFWLQSWFVFSVILILAGISYIVYRYRINQILKLQHMRNTISSNLHDDIGASLSNINILNTLALRHIHDNPKAEEYLLKTGEDIQRISESLSDIVWNVNPIYDNMDQLVSHMKRYAADMLEGKDIEAILKFPPAGPGIHLSMDTRRDLFLVFKEAINNLVKHSKATSAEINLVEEKNFVYLSVKDNGSGFDPDQIAYGHGLLNMQNRASAHAGSLSVTSAPGKGTHLELRMKIS